MYITEKALTKLMNGEALTEVERADIETALQKVKEEREAKEKANEKLRNDIVKALREHSHCPKTTTEIKNTLCEYDHHKYVSISESKICETAYSLCRDKDLDVRTLRKTVITPFSKNKRVAFYI